MSLVSRSSRSFSGCLSLASKKQELRLLSEKLIALADVLPDVTTSLGFLHESSCSINRMYKESYNLSRLIHKNIKQGSNKND